MLDSAEVIYATEGVEGLSLRTIAERANANLAAINYHFRTKSALTEAMLTRALGPLTEESAHLLNLLQTEYGSNLQPVHILAAMLLPIIRELGMPKASLQATPQTSLQPLPQTPPHRLQFLQRTTTDQSPFVRQLMSNAFTVHTERFDKAFVQSFPAKSAVDAVLYFRLFCNALPGSLCNHNTFAICRLLVARPGTMPRDILLFFAMMLNRCTLMPEAEMPRTDVHTTVDDIMRVLADTDTVSTLTAQFGSTHQAA